MATRGFLVDVGVVHMYRVSDTYKTETQALVFRDARRRLLLLLPICVVYRWLENTF